MLEICIHLDNEVCLEVLRGVRKTPHVSVAQALLFSQQQMKVGALLHEPADNIRRAVGRIIIDDPNSTPAQI